VKAVETGQVHAIWRQFYNSPCQFVAIQQIAKWLHPELFADLDPEATFPELHERFLPVVMRAIGMREAFDIGLEMSGAAPAFRDIIDKMNYGGKIAILGIAPAAFEIDWDKAIFKMLTLKGIYGREMYESWYKMIALVQSGLDISPLITHRLGIHDFEEGFAAMRSGSSGKVVLDWP
jgi:threonine 3-dehydrogenase